MCVNWAGRVLKILNRRGIGLAPLQTDWVKERTAKIDDPLKEMLVQKADGDFVGGADAVIYLSRKIWWAYGLFLVSLIPGMKLGLPWMYQLIARNRYCMNGICKIRGT